MTKKIKWYFFFLIGPKFEEMLKSHDQNIFFPLNEKEFFGDKESIRNEANLILDINNDDVWADSPKKTLATKKLKKK